MNWETHYGSQPEKPKELEETPTSVYLRRNISQVEKTNEDKTKTKLWQYEEVKLSLSEYADYKRGLEMYEDLEIGKRFDNQQSQITDLNKSIDDLTLTVLSGGDSNV